MTQAHTSPRPSALGTHQDKGAVTPQKTDPDLPRSVQDSPVEVWVGGGLLQDGRHWVYQYMHGIFEGHCHYLHYIHHSLAQVNGREGTQLRPSTENWIKDLLSMAPPIRTRPSFPLSQSLIWGSFHKPLILLHQRAHKLKTTTTEN